MTKIILVRHGETQWNREEVFRGRVDVPLNENGRAQARAAAKVLRSVPLRAVYSSPLSRAGETARILAEPHELPLELVEEFLDFSFGEWEGKTPQQVKHEYPDLYRLWTEQPDRLVVPGGESLADVRGRSVSGLEKILAHHDSDTVLLVAHRVVNKILVCFMLGLPDSAFWHVRQDPCCINVFQHHAGNYVTLLVNDTCHIGRHTLEAPPRDF